MINPVKDAGFPKWPVVCSVDKKSSTAVVTFPRACSSITKKLIPVVPFSERWCDIDKMFENKYVIIRNHFERLLSCYYGTVVHGDLENKDISKYYGARGSFEDFIRNIPELLDDHAKKASPGHINPVPSWHFAPYSLMLHVCTMSQELASSWMIIDATQYHDFMDYLVTKGANINPGDVRKRLDTIINVEYAEDFSLDSRNLHEVDFLEWREVKQKPTYERMYTKEMIEIVKSCYAEDFKLFPVIMKFNRGEE